MELQREPETVESFNYGIPPVGQEVEQKLDVNFDILNTTDPSYPQENSIVGVRVFFTFPFEEFIVGGSVSQVIHIMNREIKKPSDLSKKEANEIAIPVFKIIERLIYEVTEIALDRPGLKINFAPNEQ
ncbi:MULTISPECIES: DUF1149 family protein [Enterococcus]|uniref:DUF1149 family protein n=1 Tax=Enterococcus alishanensis TaxID=1303817 RepID=A0ABS6TBS1_9ENTE|nr:DUF1149 family protein [Enterococcus alishanensis]MBV7390337.1 DUF1149 family protein [Enterococcus alishanensis]